MHGLRSTKGQTAGNYGSSRTEIVEGDGFDPVAFRGKQLESMAITIAPMVELTSTPRRGAIHADSGGPLHPERSGDAMAIDSEGILSRIRSCIWKANEGRFKISAGEGDGYVQWIRFSNASDDEGFVDVRISPSHQIVQTSDGFDGVVWIQGVDEIEDRVSWMVDCIAHFLRGEFIRRDIKERLFGIVKARDVIVISSALDEEEMVLSRIR